MRHSNHDPAERAWVDVDLSALLRNARTVAARVGAPLLPMVKANAYGLGVVPVVHALEALQPWGYGVATPAEAAELRAAGISRPVLVFTPLLPHWIGACLEADARPCIGDLEALAAWLSRTDAPFHLEIDTGMRRAGFAWDDGALLEALGRVVGDAPGWEGAFTHFHSADEAPATAAEQWQRLSLALDRLGRRPSLVHAASSAGGFADARYGADLARPGIFLYGGEAGGLIPEPVARFQARVVAARRVSTGDTVSYGAAWRADRPTTIVTVAAGYADGVLRALSGRGVVEIAGQVFPIAGRVTMDMTMVDVGNAPVRPGQVATLFGGRVSLDAQARAAGTISYELLTALGRRVRRHHIE